METQHYQDQGYFDLREVPNYGLCGLHRFAFTVGLVVGIDEHSYVGRYCYQSLMDARVALAVWDGVDDPSGEWIKYKGAGGERSRIPDIYNTEGKAAAVGGDQS